MGGIRLSDQRPEFGATVRDAATEFCVWAPEAEMVEVILESPVRQGKAHAMTLHPEGYHCALIAGIGDGDLYRYQLADKGTFPDPASRFQPQGVHGPSQVVDPDLFAWSDAGWAGIALEDSILYELHVGAFTPEGTFAAAEAKLPYLHGLGITVVELMPVGDFPGQRNWGYDVAAPFAPARCYGTPDDLRRFVDRAHALGLAVHLDVVYNHLGPDGAYQSAFSRFFYSETHRSPWGAGINFDGPNSQPVRDYVLKNALHWVLEYHIDGLRLDATHAIVDDSPQHIVAELTAAVAASVSSASRKIIIAEDDRNLARLLRSAAAGGWGLDAVWADDFHHQMRRLLAGDSDGYFQDFDGTTKAIAATADQGWFYTGQHAPYFGGARGTDTAGLDRFRFVCCLQNHDQIGNRAMGDRIHSKIDPAAWRAASTLLLLLPETPLLFMGQEWAASTPFLYFTNHYPALGALVTEGRRREFGRFSAFADPAARENIPDPQAVQTFEASGLNWAESTRESHAAVTWLYRSLIAARKTLRVADDPAAGVIRLSDDSLLVRRTALDGSVLAAIIRLRGAGSESIPYLGSDTLRCDVVLTTEDAEATMDPQPPTVNQQTAVIEFARPGAVVLRWELAGAGGRI